MRVLQSSISVQYSQEVEVGRVDALLVCDTVICREWQCLKSDRDLDAITRARLIGHDPAGAGAGGYHRLCISLVVGSHQDAQVLCGVRIEAFVK